MGSSNNGDGIGSVGADKGDGMIGVLVFDEKGFEVKVSGLKVPQCYTDFWAGDGGPPAPVVATIVSSPFATGKPPYRNEQREQRISIDQRSIANVFASLHTLSVFEIGLLQFFQRTGANDSSSTSVSQYLYEIKILFPII